MRIRRSYPIILAVLAIAAAVTIAVVLRKHAPPEPARLLPDAGGFAYINLQWIRRINLLGPLPPAQHDPQYEQFIEATGFDFERDLEEAAVAVHYPNGPQPARPEDVRFSYVVVAKINGEKLRQYLTKVSSSIESYHAVDIYNIPLEGRTGRIAILGVDTVAVSNHPDPEVIRGMVDRSRKLASPFGGPRLLRQFYKKVPLASFAWAIFKVEPGSSQAANAAGPAGWAGFLFSKPAVLVASARFLRAIHLRAEAFTGSEDDAKQVTERAGTFLNLFHTGEQTLNPSGFDAEVKELFASSKLEQQKDRAVLTAVVPSDFLRKALTEPPAPAVPEPPAPVSPPNKGKARQKTEKSRAKPH